MAYTAHNLVWFSEIDTSGASLVGAKGILLGELAGEDFPIPKGFIVTANAYYDFIRENNLSVKINHLISSANFENPKSLEQVAKHIQNLILAGNLSEGFIKEIAKAYKKIGGLLDEPVVNIILSPTVGFTQSLDSDLLLNVKGDAVLINKIKHCWSEIYSSSNLYKKYKAGGIHSKTAVAIIVESALRSEEIVNVFTQDVKNNDKSKIEIEGISLVRKQDLEIIKKEKKGNINISDKVIKNLAETAIKLEKFLYFPQKITFGVDKNKIYILDTKPLTFFSDSDSEFNTEAKTLSPSFLEPAAAGIATGPLKFVLSEKEIGKVMPGDVIVLNKSDGDYINAIKKASAVVTLNGGRNSKAAVSARRFGIPAVSNAGDLIKNFANGHVVTVNGSKGEISKGPLRNLSSSFAAGKVLQTATKLYVTMSNPDSAEIVAKLNTDGVNPFTADEMIKKLGVHPKKMIRDGKKEVFTEKLADGIETVCKAFSGRPVVYRFSDLASNDYKNLSGGKDFEMNEPNPALGLRGAFRYLHDPESFEAEINAVKKVRDKGFTNLSVSIPLVRTPLELINVKKAINKAGLERSSNFKIWFVLETPSNVIMLEKFLETGIDGVSIDLNALSTLTLGADKGNFEISSEFSSLEPSVVWSLEHIISTCLKHNIATSLYGLGVSENSELVKKLVDFGIGSISVLPDSIDYTKKLIHKTERNLLIK